MPALGALPIVGRLWRPKKEYGRMPCIAEQVGFHGPAEQKRIEQHTAQAWWFNFLVGVGILVSSVLLGVDLDTNSGGSVEDRYPFFLADLAFTLGFLAEMILRLNQLGWNYFRDPWNFFDYTLVSMHLADLVWSITVGGGAKVATGFRLIRPMRLVRHAKGIEMFNGVYFVVQGLIDSIRTMAWTGIFLFICTYVFGISLMTSTDGPGIADQYLEVDQHFGSVRNAMLTTVQIFTLDAWTVDIVRPMTSANLWMGAAVAIVSVIICNWGVLNLVIALMVERMGVMKKEINAKNVKILAGVEKSVMNSLHDDFKANDADGSGELDEQEFKVLIRDPVIKFKLRLLGIDTDEAESYFDLLDVDKSGTLTPEEFITGLTKVRGLAKSADICALISFAEKYSRQARANIARLRVIATRADAIEERLHGMARRLHGEMCERASANQRTQDLWLKAADWTHCITTLDKDRGVVFPSLREPLS